MQNRNISSQVSIRSVQKFEQSRTKQLAFRNAVTINNVLIQTCLDPKYQYLLRSGNLDDFFYPYFYPVFCSPRKWLEDNQTGTITHIKEKGGRFYVIIDFKLLVCVEYDIMLDALLIPNPFCLLHCIEPKGQCICLAPYKTGVLVVVKFSSQYYASSPQIHFYNGWGEQEKAIVLNSESGEALLKDPQDIIVEGDKIVVSDDGKQSVIVINEDGKLLHNFTHKDLLHPRSLCVDQFSNIYVATSSKVLQIKGDCSESRILISSTTDQKSILRKLYFCKETNLLYVAYERNNTCDIVTYQFSNSDENSFKKEIQHQNSQQQKASIVSILLFCGSLIPFAVCLVSILRPVPKV